VAEAQNGLKSRLEERLGAQKLVERMEQLRQETGGLLDGRAILAILADEMGLAESPFSTLSGLDPSRPVFTRCSIESIDATREFQGRDRAGKLRKLKVADQTGSMPLTLWDEETGLVEQLGLKPGSLVRILSATLRETRFGREIYVGKNGFLLSEDGIQEDGPSEPRNIGDIGKAPGRVDVTGVILSLDSAGRGRQKMTVMRLFDGTGEIELTVPHEQLTPPAGMAQGVEILLSAALVDHQNGVAVLRCDRRSGLKIK
jgi:ssDNA-binding replication factor A large subunit